MRLLLIEDEAPLARLLVPGLEHARYQVDWFRDGAEGFRRACEGGYAVILLDLMLPSMDGLAICRRLRDRRDPTPILMLTALDEVEDRVRGFETGADDYLPKPFAFEELKARIDALIRRSRVQRRRHLTIGDLEIDTEERIVRRTGSVVPLTPREYDVLSVLAAREGAIVTRDAILNAFGDAAVTPNTVDVRIASLRRKIDSGRPAESRLIQTVHRQGYLLQSPEALPPAASETGLSR